MDYFQYRDRLKKIVMSRWQIPFTMDWERFKGRNDVILLPLDDDDIYYPNITDHLDSVFSDPKVDLAVWNTWELRLVGKPKIVPFQFGHKQVASNCYAIRASSALPKALLYHRNIEPQGMPRAVYLEDKLAIRTMHPAQNWHSLHGWVGKRISRQWQEIEIPDDLEWASGMIRELEDLTKSLRWKTIRLL